MTKTECAICNWFDYQLEQHKRFPKKKADLKLSKKIHEKSSEHIKNMESIGVIG